MSDHDLRNIALAAERRYRLYIGLNLVGTLVTLVGPRPVWGLASLLIAFRLWQVGSPIDDGEFNRGPIWLRGDVCCYFLFGLLSVAVGVEALTTGTGSLTSNLLSTLSLLAFSWTFGQRHVVTLLELRPVPG